jgi:glutathione synthase/RimK-type ligase-like ATP-grasp enzyme
MSITIAFATSSEFSQLTSDDQLAAQALRAQGLNVDAVLWDNPSLDWNAYAAIVIRSCWDYHDRPAEFTAWLDRVEKQGANLLNPADLVRWNMDKIYLSDLELQGIYLLPSVWLPRRAHVNLAHLMAEKGWAQAVVKPLVSAAANQTFLISLEGAAAHQVAFEADLQQGGLLVQEFAPEIQTQGEWSLIFFGGQYSHSVLKQPGAEDFRVQEHHGGSVKPASPPASLIAQATEILALVDSDWLYARVDGVERQGSLYLMELELIEPHLFFETHLQAPLHFADALRKQLTLKE